MRRVPGGSDQPARLQVVSDRERLGIGREQPAQRRPRAPFPAWPQDGHDQAFAVSWWNADQKLLDRAAADRLQVFADRIDVPARYKGRCWLYERPGCFNERPKVPAAAFRLQALRQARIAQGLPQAVGDRHRRVWRDRGHSGLPPVSDGFRSGLGRASAKAV